MIPTRIFVLSPTWIFVLSPTRIFVLSPSKIFVLSSPKIFVLSPSRIFLLSPTTVVFEYISTIKTNFDFNCWFLPSFVIWKKRVRNQNLNRKSRLFICIYFIIFLFKTSRVFFFFFVLIILNFSLENQMIWKIIDSVKGN